MKKVFTLMIFVLSFLANTANASSTNLGFSDVYQKGIMETGYKYPIYIGTGMIIAGTVAAITVVTAGTGAPAAVMGSSKVAALVAGGGQGSYMAGLSTIGGWVGGNAITGAAILNGTIVGLTGGSGIGLITTATAMAVDGYAFSKDLATSEIFFETRLPYQGLSIGSKNVTDSIERINTLITEVNKLQNDLITKDLQIAEIKNTLDKENEDLFFLINNRKQISDRAFFLNDQIDSMESNQIEHLKRLVENKDIREVEDIIVLSIVAWNVNNYGLFSQALESIDINKLERKGYFYYLKALESINNENIEKAVYYSLKSINDSKYALEPYFLAVMVLGSDIKNNQPLIELLSNHAINNHSSGKYKSKLTKATFLNRLSSIYFEAEDYEQSKYYANMSIDKLGPLQRRGIVWKADEATQLFKIQLANSKYMLGEVDEANNIYKKIIDSSTDEQTELLFGLYIGNTNEK